METTIKRIAAAAIIATVAFGLTGCKDLDSTGGAPVVDLDGDGTTGGAPAIDIRPADPAPAAARVILYSGASRISGWTDPEAGKCTPIPGVYDSRLLNGTDAPILVYRNATCSGAPFSAVAPRDGIAAPGLLAFKITT